MSDTGSGAPRPETARDAPSALSAPTGTPMAPQAAADDPAATALPPDVLLIVAVPDMVLFPGTVFPVAIGRDASVQAAQQALREERPIGILMQREADKEHPGGADLHRVGTLANILRYVNVVEGGHHLVVQGLQRFRVEAFVREQPFLAARVTPIDEPQEQGAEIEARLLHLKQQAMEALQLLPQVPQPLIAAVQSATSAGALADLVAAYLDLGRDERQDVLESIDLRARRQGVGLSGQAHRGHAPVAGDRQAHPGLAGRAPAPGHLARADGQHSARAGRRRRTRARGGRAGQGHRGGQAAR